MSARRFVPRGVVAAWFVIASLSATLAARRTESNQTVTRPLVSEEVAPVQSMAPVAHDGHIGEGFLRKPPGAGPFPAVLLIHGGLERRPVDAIRGYALGTHLSRFLEMGYVISAITYRSRNVDPQSTVSLSDALAAIDYLKGLSFVDSNSVVVSGCSGGGDLALEVAASTQVAAVAAEEPASILLAGVFNSSSPKRGDTYTVADAMLILDNFTEYYTAAHQEYMRAKIARISSPILLLAGDSTFSLNQFNAQILVPELRAAEKLVETMSYPGEPHCFSFYSQSPRTPRPSAALTAFQDIDGFFRAHLRTQPKPMASDLVQHVPVR